MLVPVACETLIGLSDDFVVRSFPAFWFPDSQASRAECLHVYPGHSAGHQGGEQQHENHDLFAWSFEGDSTHRLTSWDSPVEWKEELHYLHLTGIL